MSQEEEQMKQESEFNLGGNVAWFLTGACIGAADLFERGRKLVKG